MSKNHITLLGTETLIDQIATADSIEGLTVGKSRSAESFTDAVDAPLGPEEIMTIMKLVTVSFGAGTAAIKFYQTVKDLIRKSEHSESEEVQIVDSKTGKILAVINKDTAVEDIVKKINR